MKKIPYFTLLLVMTLVLTAAKKDKSTPDGVVQLALQYAFKGNLNGFTSTLDPLAKNQYGNLETMSAFAQKLKNYTAVSVSMIAPTSLQRDSITGESTYQVNVTRGRALLVTLESVCTTVTRAQRERIFCLIHGINENNYPKNGIYNNPEGSPLLPLIRAAQSTLDIEIYTMSDSSLRQVLRDALVRGLRVFRAQERQASTLP